MNAQDIIAKLDKTYTLIDPDYRDTLEESLELVQDAIRTQDYSPIDEEVFEWYLESEDQSVDYILDELKTEIESELEESGNEEEEDADSIIETYRDEIVEAIRERDNSNPVKELLRHTGEIIFFYDLGVDVNGLYGMEDQEIANELVNVKSALAIDSDKYDDILTSMMNEASYGGRLVVYFRERADNLIDLGEVNTITFKNPMVAVIDTCNGSGDHTDLDGHEFSVALNLENVFVEKTIKYNYTYAVCGLYESWCDCTRIKFSQVDNPGTIKHSSLNAELDVEALYVKAYKAGGCTFGDMDMKRHRHTVYINEFPCGTHCKDCHTFWID